MGSVVEEVLLNRAGKHGEFNENSAATWEIMRILMAQRNWNTLPDPMRHALYMDAHKMARITCGDPNEVDHWDDIAGYATLVADRLRQQVKVFDYENDIAAALAVAWNCTRKEAIERHAGIIQKLKAQATVPPTTTVDPVQEDFEAAVERAIELDGESFQTDEPAPGFLFRDRPTVAT